MKKVKLIRMLVILVIILLFTQNKSTARYYEVLDTIKVRFTVEEKIDTGVNEKYENNE